MTADHPDRPQPSTLRPAFAAPTALRFRSCPPLSLSSHASRSGLLPSIVPVSRRAVVHASGTFFQGAKKRPRHVANKSIAPVTAPSRTSGPSVALGTSDRLQKVMSRLGVASRRRSEALIAAGKVCVNGRTVRDQGVLVNSRKDRITVDGHIIEPPARALWIAVHKPRGYLSLPRVGYKRTVESLVKHLRGGNELVSVGGVDEAFSGLLVMTNERGDVPKVLGEESGHVRGWIVDCEGVVAEDDVEPMRRGVLLAGGLVTTKPADVKIVGSEFIEVRSKEKKLLTRVEVRVRENRSRLVKRLFESAGLTIVSAKRISFGPVLLGSLRRGDSRYLTANEVKALKRGVKRSDRSSKFGGKKHSKQRPR